ncbi:putative inorganic phosphate cotransporter, partial [Trichonephila inaurata madagascariensis]
MLDGQVYCMQSPSDKINDSGFPARYVFALLGFFGFFNLLAMRVNLNVAIIAMVKQSSHLSGSVPRETVACPELIEEFEQGNSSEISYLHEVSCKKPLGLVHGPIYIITQIPGGILAEKYGAKWLFAFGMLVTSIFTLLTPLAARWSVWALIFVRVIEGLGEGVAYPCINTLIGQWAPKLERSRIVVFIYTGGNIGTVFTLGISGILSNSGFLGGWPSMFYVFGILGCVWFILWVSLIHETPESHPRISKEEILLIRQGREKKSRIPTPWKSILTSIPVWALLAAHTGESWGFFTLLILAPTYLSNILHFDLKQNGLLSALPNLVLSTVSIFASILADHLRKSDKFRISTIRKTMNTIGFIGPAICLAFVAFVGCKPVAIVVLLCLALGFNGFAFSGFNATHVDMSPDFA